MISVSGLTFQYPSQPMMRFPDFAVNAGEHCLLLGDSGSGKTTLLHLVGGLLRKYTGSIRVEQTELRQLSAVALDKFRGQHIGFIFQRNHLISALNVEQNVALSPYLAGLPIDAGRIAEVLAGLGLQEKRKSRITSLSQGQAQRVAIARAVLNKPAIILADEPTSALDDRNCEKVMELLMTVANQHQSTLIVATHDQRLKDKVHRQVRLGQT